MVVLQCNVSQKKVREERRSKSSKMTSVVYALTINENDCDIVVRMLGQGCGDLGSNPHSASGVLKVTLGQPNLPHRVVVRIREWEEHLHCSEFLREMVG